ncbi:tryptophan-rich protein-like protein [Leptotrombidium deliense]|uniref:Guided entry of tail-anchored proteins factor 1 n=1 Tax=Leptotrombidium deliense TaxID=299467 RepID=A0A443SDY8_9ACAR|nr:tryptophan-rich protein-like protein [Leptotrombidium deliense]
MDSKPMSTNGGQNLSLFWFVTIYGLFAAFVPTFTNIIVSLLSYDSERNINLRKQIKELRLELGNISMLNEFAKYTRIQRKVDKMSEELKSESKIALGLIMAYLMWNYRNTPLLVLSSNIFYPFGAILSFPTGIEGAIGITPWLVVVTCIGRRLERHVS